MREQKQKASIGCEKGWTFAVGGRYFKKKRREGIGMEERLKAVLIYKNK